ITYVNDRFCEVSGYSREELLGKNHRIVKSDLHSSYFYEQMWHTISNGHIWQGEVCNRCKDGGYYWVESTITPFLDSNNKPYQYVSIRTDVTNLKNLELALEVNNERFRRSQGFANIGTWDWNIQTGELYWSQQIAPLFGYPLGDLETSYENFIEAVHPDDRELITSAITNCIEHKVDYHVEHRAVWPTGEIRWLLEKGDVIRDEDGNALNMLGVVQDITDRKMAEEALRESEEKYRCLFELSEEPMWLIVEDHFMMANRAAAQILGYESEQQLIDIHPVQLSPEYQPDGQSSLDKSKEYLATAYKQGYYRFEWTHKNISGESFPVEVSLTRIPYQGKQALFCVWRDISQRKIAEQKLLDSTTKLIEAQSLAHIGNWQADLITGGLEWSDEIFQIFGYQPGSIEPSIEVFHEAVHPDDREKVRQSERQAEITGHHDVIHRIIRPDGSIRHVQELAHAETDETGKLVKLSGTVQDITERVETETKLDETENRFSFAIEGAGDGVWDWDIPSGSMLLSGCYEKMLGFEKGELEQTIDAWQKSVHPNDIQRVQENLQAYFAGNVPHYSVELRLRCKDGSYRWILCRAETVSNDDSGKPQRMIGVHTDITDRKLMQDDIVRQKSMLDVLYQATTEFIVSGDLKTTMKNMLHYLLEITESDYGFIGQVFYDDEGQP
ncbi:MAG: PAS domain-containing protein, partial [Gammaproteobacteria bacterium]|nr:PAS domain-containing protein [Gammaproteobacteria bacterium]